MDCAPGAVSARRLGTWPARARGLNHRPFAHRQSRYRLEHSLVRTVVTPGSYLAKTDPSRVGLPVEGLFTMASIAQVLSGRFLESTSGSSRTSDVTKTSDPESDGPALMGRFAWPHGFVGHVLHGWKGTRW